MLLTIKDTKEEKLLGRKTVTAELKFDGATPKNDDVTAELAKQVKAEPETVSVRKIEGRFGTTVADVTAHVYDSVDKRYMLEKKPKPKKEEGEA